MSTAEVVSSNSNGIPVLHEGSGGADDPLTIARSLRQFHFNGSAQGVSSVSSGEFLPAFLYPYRDPQHVRGDYPLFIGASSEDQPPCQPLGDVLRHIVEQTSPAQVLKDNLVRLEVCVRQVLGDDTGLLEARRVLAASGEMLLRELDLPGEHAERLRKDLNALLEQLPGGGELLGSPKYAHLYLFVSAARQRLRERRAAFEAELRQLCAKLQLLLDVERSKDPGAHARVTRAPPLPDLGGRCVRLRYT